MPQGQRGYWVGERGSQLAASASPLGSHPHLTPPARPCRAITLENTLVILSTVAPDAGRYYVQAVNDKNGDNKTSQPITLTVASECGGHRPPAPLRPPTPRRLARPQV